MTPRDYWKANLKLLTILLIIWFVISFGFGIILSDFLDQFSLGGFKLGFWFAQQGSIYGFVLLIFAYVIGMSRIEKKFQEKYPGSVKNFKQGYKELIEGDFFKLKDKSSFNDLGFFKTTNNIILTSLSHF